MKTHKKWREPGKKEVNITYISLMGESKERVLWRELLADTDSVFILYSNKIC